MEKAEVLNVLNEMNLKPKETDQVQSRGKYPPPVNNKVGNAGDNLVNDLAGKLKDVELESEESLKRASNENDENIVNDQNTLSEAEKKAELKKELFDLQARAEALYSQEAEKIEQHNYSTELVYLVRNVVKISKKAPFPCEGVLKEFNIHREGMPAPKKVNRSKRVNQNMHNFNPPWNRAGPKSGVRQGQTGFGNAGHNLDSHNQYQNQRNYKDSTFNTNPNPTWNTMASLGLRDGGNHQGGNRQGQAGRHSGNQNRNSGNHSRNSGNQNRNQRQEKPSNNKTLETSRDQE